MTRRLTVTALLALLLLLALAQGTSLTFPGQAFHGLQLQLAVQGATLDSPQDHVGGDLAERRYQGTLAGALTVSGTATAGDRAGRSQAVLRATIFADDRLVQSFERKLFEFQKVDFTLQAPAGATRSVEFFVHVSEGGEDGVRVRARLGVGRAPQKVGLERLLELYVRRIPNGLVSSGRLNNLLSVAGSGPNLVKAGYGFDQPSVNPLETFRCGGYQKQVLDFLDAVRCSNDPAERALLDNYDYGPIEGSAGFHQAVVLYPRGSDWQTSGIVLDPWPNQRPEHVPITQWAARFRLARPSQTYAENAGNYPIYGGAYKPPNSFSTKLTTEEENLVRSLQTLSPDHYAYQRSLGPEARKVWVRGAMERFKTKGHVFIDCPVAARLVDAQGRFTGLKGNQLAAQLPGSTVIVYPESAADTWTELGYAPGAGLKLELTGTSAGQARVTVVEDGPPARLYFHKIGVAQGQTQALSLSPPQPSTAPTAPVEKREPKVLFQNTNPGGVLNGPQQAVWISFPRPVQLTQIQTYHWNSAKGAVPGAISLIEKSSGQKVGSWQALGSPGQGGVPNAFWTVRPEFQLPAGTYQVVVSDPGSWSYNPQSTHAGFVTVSGYELAASGQFGDDQRLGSVWHVVENGAWQGTWTHRPGTRIFDAVWRHPQGGEVRDVLEVESITGQRLIFYRRGNRGRYSAELGATGRTARGTMSWNDGGSSFTATVDP